MTCGGTCGGRSTDYSLIWVILALIVICVLVIAGPFLERLFQSVSNELEKQELETAFQDVRHPAGTERVSTRNLMGSFTGHEQGCDFFVGEIRSYSNGQDIVLSIYRDQQVNGAPIHVLFLEDRQIPSQARSALPESLNDLVDWQLPADVGQRQLYMVYVVIQDYGESNCR